MPDRACEELAPEYLCIVCPMGCRLQVSKDAETGELIVEGAACKRGRDYVLQEATAPQRVLTTTLATAWGTPLPVRSAAPIDKGLLLSVQPMLSAITIDRDVEIGEAVVPDLDGKGTPLVATATARAPRR